MYSKNLFSIIIFCFLGEELEKVVEENLKKRAKGFANFISELETKYTPKKKAKLSITDGSTKKRTRKSTK